MNADAALQSFTCLESKGLQKKPRIQQILIIDFTLLQNIIMMKRNYANSEEPK